MACISLKLCWTSSVEFPSSGSSWASLFLHQHGAGLRLFFVWGGSFFLALPNPVGSVALFGVPLIGNNVTAKFGTSVSNIVPSGKMPMRKPFGLCLCQCLFQLCISGDSNHCIQVGIIMWFACGLGGCGFRCWLCGCCCSWRNA